VKKGRRRLRDEGKVEGKIKLKAEVRVPCLKKHRVECSLSYRWCEMAKEYMKGVEYARMPSSSLLYFFCQLCSLFTCFSLA